MKIKDYSIIETEWINSEEIRIKSILESYNEISKNSWDAGRLQGELNFLGWLKDRIKPLTPIVDLAFDAGINTKYSTGCHANDDDKICYCKKDTDCKYPIYPTKEDYINNTIIE